MKSEIDNRDRWSDDAVFVPVGEYQAFTRLYHKMLELQKEMKAFLEGVKKGEVSG